LTNDSDSISGNVRFVAVGNVHDLHGVLRRLHEENIMSVLVEGGARVLHSFLECGLWDEARVIVSDNSLGSGLKAPSISRVPTTEQRSSTDRIYYYYNKS
jgi:diaminohydroxyphosphoribosylaminopyrimidine deaminase/5-amino-6-(5-phosphoribosylamino)uracil reductase